MNELTQQEIQDMNLMNDVFMSVVFQNKDCIELVLQTILKKNVSVIKHAVQHEVNSLYGKSVKMDVYLIDDKGKHYDVEIQRNLEGADVRRARYNSSILDTHSLQKGEDYPSLKDSYVIFICEHDVFKKGFQRYHIDRMIEETQEPFLDGSHIIYVNFGKVEKVEDEALALLQNDFLSKDANQLHYEILKNEVIYQKKMGGLNYREVK